MTSYYLHYCVSEHVSNSGGLCNKALPTCSYRQVGRACCTSGCSSGAALPGLWVSQGGSHPSWTSGPGRLRLGTGLPSLTKQITWPSPKSRGGAVHGSQCGCGQVMGAETVEELGPVMQSSPGMQPRDPCLPWRGKLGPGHTLR